MRVNKQMLENRVKYLNELTNNPIEPYTKEDGKFKANIGSYHLDSAYGGVRLVKMYNEAGAIDPVFNEYESKRRALELIDAYILGIETIK